MTITDVSTGVTRLDGPSLLAQASSVVRGGCFITEDWAIIIMVNINRLSSNGDSPHRMNFRVLNTALAWHICMGRGLKKTMLLVASGC